MNYIKSILRCYKNIVFVILALVAVLMPYASSLAATIDGEDILKQKNSYTVSDSVNLLNSGEISTLDEQYQKNLIIEDEIDYKVGVIVSKYTKNKTLQLKAVSVAKNDKIAVMQIIVSLLNNSNKIDVREKNILIYFLSKYFPYSDNQVLIQQSQNIIAQQVQNQVSASVVVPYNRSSASLYAQQYAYNYNLASYPDLNNLGGDCTNFVSQAMRAGGKTLQGNWYIYKKNNTYITPTSISQLNSSWILSDPSPWISAKEFENYWTSRLTNEVFTSLYVASNQGAVFNKSYYRGDIVQILVARYWWYEAYHSMVITEYGNSDFLMTYHTSNQKNKPLHDIATTYNSTNYKFKFYSVK